MEFHKLAGKDLLLCALRHEPVPAVPWVPYAGVHAGKLKGYTGSEILQDGNKLVESLLAVNEIYDPDGQPVLFDLQVEAEILGCHLIWPENGPPLVETHPLAGAAEIPTWLPTESAGRLPMILKVMERMKRTVGDKTALYGLIAGPLTLASHLRGTDIFYDMVYQPDYFIRLIAYMRDIAAQMAKFYIQAGMDVVALVDPLVSQISPRHFAKYFREPYQCLFEDIRGQGAFSSFFVCGDATKNIAEMCETRPDAIAVDENLDMPATKRITDAYNITLCGNVPLTTKMLLGTQQDNMKFVVDLLDEVDHRNLILAPGCDMPYETPIENVVGCLQAVRNPLETKAMLQNYSALEIDLDRIDLPDYPNLEKPLIEVFTLDSTACAACTYMLDSVIKAASEFGQEVEVVEYKFTLPENVARVKKMGIEKLPSVYINGRLKYSSIIPDRQELAHEIRKLL